MCEDEFTELPIDGVLDLHTFKPSDVKSLVPEYLDECRALGIYEIRIIHGKGIGALRETVHSALKKYPHVIEFHLATQQSGGWGATSIQLSKSEKENEK
jgi:DNA-nicking Smr family endonuclease